MNVLSREWPPIAEPKLLERLALDDAGFLAFTEKIAGLIGPREFSEDDFAHALAYPWERPSESYLLQGESTRLLAGLTPDELSMLAAGRAIDGSSAPVRYPLLAFGSNAAPSKLAAKLAHLPADHHDAFVISGELHGFDVGVSAHAAIYGAMPATIFPSPGTGVRAAVIWVTAPQLTVLAWSEMSYFFGRLDGIEFVPDFNAPPIESVFLFVSRFGAHALDGAPVAMDAVEARGRRAFAITQHELLDRLARGVIGPSASAADIVRGVFEDFASTTERVRAHTRKTAVQFSSANWTRFGGG